MRKALKTMLSRPTISVSDLASAAIATLCTGLAVGALAAPANPLLSVPEASKAKASAQQGKAGEGGPSLNSGLPQPGGPSQQLPPPTLGMGGQMAANGQQQAVAPAPLTNEEREMLRTLTLVAVIGEDAILKSYVAPAGLFDAPAANSPLGATALNPGLNANRFGQPGMPGQQGFGQPGGFAQQGFGGSPVGGQNVMPFNQGQQFGMTGQPGAMGVGGMGMGQGVMPTPVTFVVTNGKLTQLGTMPVVAEVIGDVVRIRLARKDKERPLIYSGGIQQQQMPKSAFDNKQNLTADTTAGQRIDPRRAVTPSSSGSTGMAQSANGSASPMGGAQQSGAGR